MTNIEANKALAQAVGWHCETIENRWHQIVSPSGERGTILLSETLAWFQCPDFCRDLDAVHSAESKLLRETSWHIFIKNLECTVERFSTIDEQDRMFLCIHASARERTQALLETMGMWIP